MEGRRGKGRDLCLFLSGTTVPDPLAARELQWGVFGIVTLNKPRVLLGRKERVGWGRETGGSGKG